MQVCISSCLYECMSCHVVSWSVWCTAFLMSCYVSQCNWSGWWFQPLWNRKVTLGLIINFPWKTHNSCSKAPTSNLIYFYVYGDPDPVSMSKRWPRATGLAIHVPNRCQPWHHTTPRHAGTVTEFAMRKRNGWLHTCVCLHLCIYMYLHMYVYISMIYIYMSIYIHTLVCIYIYMHLYLCNLWRLNANLMETT